MLVMHIFSLSGPDCDVFLYMEIFLYNNRTCCIIMNDACDDVARVRDEREKIHQYRTKRENDRTLLSYVERIP